MKFHETGWINVFFFPFLMAGMTLMAGCYYDVEEELYPGSALCDTTDFTYNTAISPLIENNCLSCHSSISAQGDVILATYNDVKSYGQNGLLLATIRHEAGFSPMPKGGRKLKSCDIRKIELWVLNNFPP